MESLKPHVDTLLFQICFPILYFNNQDYALWTEEPHEYIRKSFDPMEDYIDPRHAVITLFLDLAKLRYKSTVPKILNFCNDVLTRYMQVQNPNDKPFREKEGVMGVLGALHEYLVSKKATKDSVEPLLITHSTRVPVAARFHTCTGLLGHATVCRRYLCGKIGKRKFSLLKMLCNV